MPETQTYNQGALEGQNTLTTCIESGVLKSTPPWSRNPQDSPGLRISRIDRCSAARISRFDMIHNWYVKHTLITQLSVLKAPRSVPVRPNESSNVCASRLVHVHTYSVSTRCLSISTQRLGRLRQSQLYTVIVIRPLALPCWRQRALRKVGRAY